MIKRITALLPGTDCAMCGMSCAEFAAFLLSGELTPDYCPVLEESGYQEQRELLLELLASIAHRAKSGHLIDTHKCNGCGICVSLCEYNSANSVACRLGKGPAADEKLALRVVDGCVVLADEDLCTRLIQAADKCTKCQDHCPNEAILLI